VKSGKEAMEVFFGFFFFAEIFFLSYYVQVIGFILI